MTTTVAYASPTPQPSPVTSTGAGRTVVYRTETSTAYELANGKILTELHAGPIRVKQADSSWADIDTHLIADGSTLRPKVAKSDVRFSTGGSGPFAKIEQPSGATLELGWAGQLPKPDIDGSRAIYRGVVADGAGDLVATALSTGLRFDVVLNRRPTGPVEIKVSIIGKGLEVSKGKGGQLRVRDGDRVVATSSTPVVYDATSPFAVHSRKGQQVRAAQGGQKRIGDITTEVADNGKGKTLVLKPSPEFLANPATAYPVTVDPSVVLPRNGDTDVNSVFDGNNVTGGYLKAGTEAGGEKARTYLRFNTQGLKVPTSAVLRLTNLDAPSCGPTVGDGIQVRRVTGFWAADEQTWTPQPTNTTENAVISTEGSRLGSCGSGTMTWNVTPIVAKWAAGTPNHGLILQSPTETMSANYRVFASAENTDGLEPPVLEVTSDEIITPGEGTDPADPGPAPYKPGRVESETGVWITDATDLAEDGLITTRSHNAGQRIDITQANEAVLGPNWRFEPLGGQFGDRLQDYSANGYLQIKLTTKNISVRFLVDAADPNKFVSPDGTGTIVRNTDGTFTHTTTLNSTDETSGNPISANQVDVWTAVNGTYLITATGNSQTGMTGITYDSSGRFTRLAAPTTKGTDCRTMDATKCSVAQYAYAVTTTATSSTLGDIIGQLKTITYDAAGDAAPGVAASYAYDSIMQLREITDARQLDGEPVKTTTYTYDSAGNITQLSSPEAGAWNLTYADAGKLASYTQVTTPATTAIPPTSQCKYMTQFLWGYDGCIVPDGVSMSYGGAKLPVRDFWVRPSKKVKGVSYDGCTSPFGSFPGGFNFRAACNMHDYGYGIIYYSSTDTYWTLSKAHAADSVFYTTLRDYVCTQYRPANPRRNSCLRWARTYYLGVKYGGGWPM